MIVMMMTVLQPKQIMEIKDFLLTARRQDAKCKCVSLCFFESWCCTKDCTVPMMTYIWLSVKTQ